jgi:hypothetical protein
MMGLAGRFSLSQQDDGHAQDLVVRDTLGVGRVGLKDELVDADGDRTHEEGVEFLVILVSVFFFFFLDSGSASPAGWWRQAVMAARGF